MVQSLWKAVWKFLRKLKIELSYDPAISLLGVHLDKAIIQKDRGMTVFMVALFTVVKTWRQPKCLPTDEWIKMWHRHLWTL